MRACVYCKTRYEKGSAVTFHKFPSASEYSLKLWIKNMKIVNWTPKTSDYLCSKHFTDSCFIKHQSRTTFKKCSIPTIFLETKSSLASAQAKMSKDDYQCRQEVVINFDQFNSPSVTVKVEPMSYDFQYSEMNPKRMSVPSTSYNTSQCRTPKRQRTLAEMSASVKLDHQYETTSKCSKKELKRVKTALRMSQKRVKVLSQQVKCLKMSVSSLKTVITNLKRKKHL